MSSVERSIAAFNAQRAAEKRRASILDPDKTATLQAMLASCVAGFAEFIDGRRRVRYHNNFQAVDMGVHQVGDKARSVLAEPSIYHAIVGCLNDKPSPDRGKVFRIDPETGEAALLTMRIDLVAVPDEIDLGSYDYELHLSPGSLWIARHELSSVQAVKHNIQKGRATRGNLGDVQAFSQVLGEVRAAEAKVAS